MEQPTRRSFIKTAVAATAAGYAFLNDDAVKRVRAAVAELGELSADAAAANEDFWREVQTAFTVDRSIINLNNGGVSPAPAYVQQALRRYLEFSHQAPTKCMWDVLRPQYEGVRSHLAEHFGCDPEEMAITRNTSESLVIALGGIQLEPGDEVLTTWQDYPRMINMLKQRQQRDGIVIKQFGWDPPTASDQEIVKLFEDNITNKTRVILLSHMVFYTGQILPVGDICRLARARGIKSVVDGAHAFAHFCFKRDDLDCDYYGTSLHKWLTAPHGTGFLYVKRDLIKDTYPLMPADDPFKDDIRKFEEIGTHPAGPKLAISHALTFHEGLGPARREARLRYLRDRCANRLIKHPRVKAITPLEKGRSCGLVNLSFEGIDPDDMLKHLWNKHHIVVVAIKNKEQGFGGVRISPNVYNTLGEIDRCCAAIEEALDKGLLDKDKQDQKDAAAESEPARKEKV